MSAVVPTPETLQEFAASPDTGPFVMVNLLKFAPNGGRETYARYAQGMESILAKHGAHSVYIGRFAELLIGEETWDAIALVEYPSRQVFLEMIASPEYQTVRGDREGGLERTVLYATTPGTL